MIEGMIRDAIRRVLVEKLPGVLVVDWSPLDPADLPYKCEKCGRGGAWVVKNAATGKPILSLCGICTKGVSLGRPLPSREAWEYVGDVQVELDMSALEVFTPPHGFESEGTSEEWWVCTLCGQPIYDPSHRDDQFLADLVERITRHVDRAIGLKHEYLEAMMAAYLTKTKVMPEEVVLVQQMRDNSIYFWFEKKGEPAANAGEGEAPGKPQAGPGEGRSAGAGESDDGRL